MSIIRYCYCFCSHDGSCRHLIVAHWSCRWIFFSLLVSNLLSPILLHSYLSSSRISRKITPFLFLFHSVITTFRSSLHHLSSFTPPSLILFLHSTISVPLPSFHHLSSSSFTPPSIFLFLHSTISVPHPSFHHLCSSSFIPPSSLNFLFILLPTFISPPLCSPFVQSHFIFLNSFCTFL